MIKFNNESKTFHLMSSDSSYIFKVLDVGHLEHIYYGKKLQDKDNYNNLLFREIKANSCTYVKEDETHSYDYLMQELPTYGMSDYREGQINITYENGSIISDFKFFDYQIYKGKKAFDAKLPNLFATSSECETLEITLIDETTNVEIILQYCVFEKENIISRSVKVNNKSNEKIILNRVMSLSLDLPTMDYQMIHLDGGWIKERHITKRDLSYGNQSISSTRGTSSSNHNPFVALVEKETNEFVGDVYGFSLIYSGNFLADVFVNNYNQTRVSMGINPFMFDWNLDVNQSFTTPEVVMNYSDCGLNKMSQQFHDLFLKNLMPQNLVHTPSDILINNWEATYFDFNEEKIYNMAKKAKDLGIEMVVLDDGWFGVRNDDKTSLGDWFTDYNKLPNGIESLAKSVKDLDLKFGLWFEPEMVSEESKLYKEYPNWVISTPNRSKSLGRNQCVLDFSNKEVVDNIYLQMSKVIDSTKLDYIKWDMNRNITEKFSNQLNSDKQGEFFHRYILGVYDLAQRIRDNFPDVIIEMCSAGGNRFDPGMLYYGTQIWCSDNTDPVERLKIQEGTSLVYPLRSIGSHVSAIPNHQVNRLTPLKMRGDVAFFGTFGYELNLNDDLDFTEVKEQVKTFKEIRSLIQYGKFTRLQSSFENNISAWMVNSQDEKTIILGIYQVLSKPNPPFEYLKIRGLNLSGKYLVLDEVYTGSELINHGILINKFGINLPSLGDYQSVIIKIEKIGE